MRYHLFKKLIENVIKIKETSFLLSKCLVSIARHRNKIVKAMEIRADAIGDHNLLCLKSYKLRFPMKFFKK